jgi:hypothetical protein
VWVSLGVATSAFIVRLPAIVEPLGPDQGVYVTIAWGLQRGLALYRDLWEQKPPGIYLTYWLGFTVFGDKASSVFWLDYLAGALTALVLLDLGRRLVSLRFGALAAAVYAIGTLPAARHMYGGFLERAVTETFISPLAAAAAWAAVVAVLRKTNGWAVAAGLCIGLAAVFKPTALVYWPALLVWIWWVADAPRARRFALYSIPGLLVAPLLTLAWLSATGLLREAWVAVVEYPMAYLAVGGGGIVFTVYRFAQEVWRRVRSDEVWALGSLSALIALCAWRWRSTKTGWVGSLGVIWLGASLVAVVANGPRLFTTYFVPPLVPLCLLIAWLLDRTLASGRFVRVGAGILALGLTGVMVVRSGSMRRALSITAWDTHQLVGRADRQEYLGRFRSRDAQGFSAADNDRLADYVRTHTAQTDRLFVFGMAGGTYFSSGRLPASRFLWAYPPASNLLDRPEFHLDTLASELAQAAPRYIVLQRHNGDRFSGWRAEDAFAAPPMVALLRSYGQETTIGDFVLYRRTGTHP